MHTLTDGELSDSDLQFLQWDHAFGKQQQKLVFCLQGGH